jgi:hypothetical protein
MTYLWVAGCITGDHGQPVVVGYIQGWYMSFQLKHQTSMGKKCGQGIMVKNEYILEILNLRSDILS